ncbi:hypothetical protein BHE74_00036215 [Ensete ventricosum]|nr:hypothetical protein BHE74_00036215 [Ensete ventricosum]
MPFPTLSVAREPPVGFIARKRRIASRQFLIPARGERDDVASMMWSYVLLSSGNHTMDCYSDTLPIIAPNSDGEDEGSQAHCARKRPLLRVGTALQVAALAGSVVGGCPYGGLGYNRPFLCRWEIVYPCILDPDGEDEGS